MYPGKNISCLVRKHFAVMNAATQLMRKLTT